MVRGEIYFYSGGYHTQISQKLLLELILELYFNNNVRVARVLLLNSLANILSDKLVINKYKTCSSSSIRIT